jgi:TonB family protein
VRTRILGALAGIVAAAIASPAFFGPAFADIAAFNAAVKASDFKKAAAEAAATWPTLDKSREDIALIAREFGFAAFIASDFAAARSYSEFASGRSSGDADGLLSTVLLRLSEHRLKPSGATRDRLNEALVARSALPGFDGISFLGMDAVVAHDFEAGRWKNAEASSDLAVKLTAGAGPSYALQHRRFALYAAIAEYMSTEDPAVYDQFSGLRRAVLKEIDDAPSDAEARRFVPLYWETTSWRDTLEAHLKALGKEHQPQAGASLDIETTLNSTERRKALLHQYGLLHPCQKVLKLSVRPKYPSSAMYRGFVGSVVLEVDIDASGQAINPEVLAAVPEKYFGKTAVDSAKNMKFEKGQRWDEAKCTMAETGHVVIFRFEIPNR